MLLGEARASVGREHLEGREGPASLGSHWSGVPPLLVTTGPVAGATHWGPTADVLFY